MADLCRVFVAGNFNDDIERRVRDDGTTYGFTTLCAGRTALVGGQPITTTVNIPVEVIGANRVSSVVQQFGSGSRVLIEGHLEQRTYDDVQLLPRTDSTGEVLVHVSRCEMVVVIDAILNAAQPVPEREAGDQPTRLFWQEQA